MEDCELLCVCVSDASDRLFNEFQLAIQAAKFLGEYSTEFSLYDAQLSVGKERIILAKDWVDSHSCENGSYSNSRRDKWRNGENIQALKKICWP